MAKKTHGQPFKSKAQEKKCWAMNNEAKKMGKTPTWDCQALENKTKNKGKLPKNNMHYGND